ncbi:hypothetical protein [Pelistega suis]|uniref:Uncharacterized protein n=1 Tax=Pelistega suis TaxID=1631957 RepID=A0A849P785_9BURK|nr:hypothetical protein [Pelistega suis]NOL51642.1 hypothetical protein [Pelistega suis]
MTTLIPVGLVVGLSPSLRGALIERLQSFLAKTVVLPISHRPVSVQGMCLCCQMHNETSDKLRQLFMQALQRKRAAFEQVWVDCKEGIDPSSVSYTLQQDFFLKERFREAGTILVLDRLLLEKVLTAYEDAMMYFSHTSLIVLAPALFKDERESQALVEKLEVIYEHIRIFQPTFQQASLIQFDELTPEYWENYQRSLPVLVSPTRHRLFV